MSNYVKCNNGLEVCIGNTKVGKDTVILNFNSAGDCPAMKLGLCAVGFKCYALKAEKQYPACLPYRRRQENYWDNVSISDICADFDQMLKRRKYIKYLRFSEAGDFKDVASMQKLDDLACYLKETHGITTYGYTARVDLDYTFQYAICKRSYGFTIPPIGQQDATIVRPSKEILGTGTVSIQGKGYYVCPMTTCAGCKLCKVPGTNVVFPLR